MANGQRQFVLGVDLDGVVADFYEGIRPIAAEWLGVSPASLTREVTYGVPEWKLDRIGGDKDDAYERLHRFAVTQRDLFRNLKPIGTAPAALRRISALEGVRIRIITHRLYIKYFHREALSQTVDWLDHYGIPYWDLCFMKEKAAVGANLYIEDSPSNVRALRSAGCEVVVFSNSTNQDLERPRAASWDEVELLVRERLAEFFEPPSRVRGPRRAEPRARSVVRDARSKKSA